MRWANLQKAYLVGANLQEALLGGANLQGAILGDANLQGTDLRGANLQEADLSKANLQKAILGGANLKNRVGANLKKAYLREANLQGADLRGANLQEAYLVEANLQGAYLRGANLQEADLWGTNLQEADLSKANLQEAVFEIKSKCLPDIVSIASARNLSRLKYRNFPHALVELRKAFKEFGMRRQEQEITYAIKHSEFENAWVEPDESAEKALTITNHLIAKIRVSLGWFFFELPCAWGMLPERSLFIIASFILLFSVPYRSSLVKTLKTDGIWKVWIPERVRADLGANKPELLRLHGWKAWKIAFYFSILSAFNIGWRDLNVGGWIAKIQPQEYRLQASGWVRSVSGFQALLSVYLLALFFLSYFSNPFDSF